MSLNLIFRRKSFGIAKGSLHEAGIPSGQFEFKLDKEFHGFNIRETSNNKELNNE